MATIGLISIKIGTDIHVPVRMNPNNLPKLLTLLNTHKANSSSASTVFCVYLWQTKMVDIIPVKRVCCLQKNIICYCYSLYYIGGNKLVILLYPWPHNNPPPSDSDTFIVDAPHQKHRLNSNTEISRKISSFVPALAVPLWYTAPLSFNKTFSCRRKKRQSSKILKPQC